MSAIKFDNSDIHNIKYRYIVVSNCDLSYQDNINSESIPLLNKGDVICVLDEFGYQDFIRSGYIDRNFEDGILVQIDINDTIIYREILEVRVSYVKL